MAAPQHGNFLIWQPLRSFKKDLFDRVHPDNLNGESTAGDNTHSSEGRCPGTVRRNRLGGLTKRDGNPLVLLPTT